MQVCRVSEDFRGRMQPFFEGQFSQNLTVFRLISQKIGGEVYVCD